MKNGLTTHLIIKGKALSGPITRSSQSLYLICNCPTISKSNTMTISIKEKHKIRDCILDHQLQKSRKFH